MNKVNGVSQLQTINVIVPPCPSLSENKNVHRQTYGCSLFYAIDQISKRVINVQEDTARAAPM